MRTTSRSSSGRCRDRARRRGSRTRATSDGPKAIYRAQVRTKPQLTTVCTAHVMHQIPGQNRIFMAWYSQGTQVIDFTENRRRHARLQGGGLVHPRERERVGVGGLQGRSRTPNGTYTYYGATGDFSLGEARPQHDRHLQGHAAGAAEAADWVAGGPWRRGQPVGRGVEAPHRGAGTRR